MTYPNPLTQAWASVVARAEQALGYDIRYDYGHWVELTNNYKQLGNDPINKALIKQPMVLLLEDFPVQRGTTSYYGIGTFTLLIAIATSKDYTSAQRETNSFIPYLNPIYEQIMHELTVDNIFLATEPMEHTVTDRKYLGRVGLYGNEGNIMDAYIDAKEIRGLRLTVTELNCLTAININ